MQKEVKLIFVEPTRYSGGAYTGLCHPQLPSKFSRQLLSSELAMPVKNSLLNLVNHSASQRLTEEIYIFTRYLLSLLFTMISCTFGMVI